MSDAPLDISMPLQRAARTERDKVAGVISRIQERLEALERERDKLRGELARLEERDHVLKQIIDPDAPAQTEHAGVVLRGARLRVEVWSLGQDGTHRQVV